MMKRNRPLSDYNWLCQLDERKGLSVGKTYRSITAAKSFVNVISEFEFNNVANIIKQAKFICSIGDGSTDASIKEQEMWYLRSCSAGKISVSFVGVKTVERPTAENIVEGVKYILSKNLHLEYTEEDNSPVM